jgi:glutamine amidotransferase
MNCQDTKIRNDAVIVNGNTGNLYSVYNALTFLGYQVKITQNADEILSSRRVVMPGVGAFAAFMQGLKQTGLQDAIMGVVQKQTPVLGICVGMQVLLDHGEENGIHPGLGLLAGTVRRFAPSESLTIPQTGWNTIQVSNEQNPLFKEIQQESYVYFNHAYYCAPESPQTILASTTYGISYASAVQKENVFGVQFHPEKSHKVGLKLLSNFMSM